MHLLVFTDIYGNTPKLQAFVQNLTNDASIISPYTKEPQTLTCEQDVYTYYLKHAGHDMYYQKCLQVMQKQKSAFKVLSFSAGACVLWRTLTQDLPTHYKGGLGFYPSAIRHYLDLEPKHDAHFVFPAKEEHFNLQDTLNCLTQKQHFSFEQSTYLHGFLNPYSKHFNTNALHSFEKIIRSWLTSSFD